MATLPNFKGDDLFFSAKKSSNGFAKEKIMVINPLSGINDAVKSFYIAANNPGNKVEVDVCMNMHLKIEYSKEVGWFTKVICPKVTGFDATANISLINQNHDEGVTLEGIVNETTAERINNGDLHIYLNNIAFPSSDSDVLYNDITDLDGSVIEYNVIL